MNNIAKLVLRAEKATTIEEAREILQLLAMYENAERAYAAEAVTAMEQAFNN